MEATNTQLLILLLLALLLASWLMGYQARGRRRRLPPDPDYFVGLNYLLNDEPDDAIDVFIAALELNASTFDTHLALGKLLRRRGKVDRAIEHFQSLLASGGFNARQITELRIQLLRSFIAAGLLDRAEQLLLELQQSTSAARAEALRLAIMLYQMEKEWRAALDAASELQKLTPLQYRHDLNMQMTHFHCEIAEVALQQQEPARARDELGQALQLFKGNVRVYLLLAQVDSLDGAHDDAVAWLQKAIRVDPSLFPEIAPALEVEVRAAGKDSENWLPQELERELGTDPAFRSALAQQSRRQQGALGQLTALLEGLHHAPSLPLLECAIRVAAEEKLLQDVTLDAGARVLQLHLQSLPRFRCEHCGFELRRLHWACPGCSCWGMVKPINTLIANAPDSGQVLNRREST